MWKLLQSLSGLRTSSAGSRHLLWAALQPVSTFCCRVVQRPARQQAPVLHQDHILRKQVQDWPSAQTGLHNPNTCPKGCASLGVSLSSPCPSTAHWHTAAKPRKCGFYGFFFPHFCIPEWQRWIRAWDPQPCHSHSPGTSPFLPVLFFQPSLTLHY